VFKYCPYLQIMFILQEYASSIHLNLLQSLTLKKEVSTVQSKLDSTVLETRWSDFCDFNPTQGKTYPFTPHSYPFKRTAHGEALGPLGGDFVAPPWDS
jgi:hypothetical protein